MENSGMAVKLNFCFNKDSLLIFVTMNCKSINTNISDCQISRDVYVLELGIIATTLILRIYWDKVSTLHVGDWIHEPKPKANSSRRHREVRALFIVISHRTRCGCYFVCFSSDSSNMAT
jgi:hypothetical protein